ncbi:hypothetical protein BG011_000564 [Mortierella polycephala]|uniref:FAD-binding domain-containing protein n=1 Tax=Mortierella polycephala TaxID=41804 RepID=A0A9P6PMB5_9FUNG|nr:hypothetical protein BG011_000564 [Mortierella polycephala]
MPVFEQLGLYEDLLRISYPNYCSHVYNGSTMEYITKFDNPELMEKMGYDYVVFSRVELYRLLLSRIPKDKILFNKRILSVKQDESKVTIRAADNTAYEGCILVGADGAYSAVRQNLYKQLEKEGLLPYDDMKQMDIKYSILVGTTKSLPTEFHEHLKNSFTHNALMIGDDSSYTLTTKVSQDESFRSSGWPAETHQDLIEKVHDFKTPYGPLRRLIDHTDKDRISKMFLENKLFKTWYHGRVVLIGDAVHKLLPSSGQGAVNAMQDAVLLANCLYEINSWRPEEITTAFKDYKEHRFSHCRKQFTYSERTACIMYGQKWWQKLMRNIVCRLLPSSALSRDVNKEASYRPQVSFLPQTPKRGTMDVQPQRASKIR